MTTMAALGIVFAILVAIHVGASLSFSRKKGNGEKSVTTILINEPPFVALCISGRKRGTKRAMFTAHLQMAVFIIACVFGYRQGVFSRELVSPVHIGLGLLAGRLIFGVSLLVTQQSVRASASHFFDFHSLWEFIIENPAVLMQFATVSIAEEMIYRVGLQPLLIGWLGNAIVGVVLVAIVFSCVHEHFFKNEFMQSFEFMGFALLLGFLFYWTGSLILVIVVHAVRNIEIAFLEHVILLDETESEEIAARESEFLSGQRLAVLVTAPPCGMEIAYWEYQAWSEPVAEEIRPAEKARLNMER
jgi:membrane protease YdiL (CAAX protease family)